MAVGLSPGAVTALDRLEQRGFVSGHAIRRPAAGDARGGGQPARMGGVRPARRVGAPFVGELSDRQLEAVIRFLRGGTEINERRARQLLED